MTHSINNVTNDASGHPLPQTTGSPDSTTSGREFDVIVVGGGPAGLSGAVALGRARRSVLVIDSGQPRNAPAAHMHNFLSRDGTPPHEFLSIGREEVVRYGGEVVTGSAVSAAKLADGGFQVSLDDGRAFRARRLLVTTGLVDELPEVPGLRERWGRDVLHCPYCHGWEVRDQAIGVLGTGAISLHHAQLWRQWSDRVTLLAQPGMDLNVEARAELDARGIALVEGEVTSLTVCDDALAGVTLADGRSVALEALVVAPKFQARSGLLVSLGLELSEQRFGEQVIGSSIAADAMGATSEPGIWVAGNVTNIMAQVVVAAASGLTAGAAINAAFLAEEVRTAVARLVPV